MSYRYIDNDRDILRVEGVLDAGDTYVAVVSRNGGGHTVRIPNADAPTVAAELLKAAGQESTILLGATGKVEELPDGSVRCGMTDASEAATAGWAWARAAELATIGRYIENKTQRETEAAEKLQERRDALLRSFGYTHSWDRAKPMFRAAIDRIIELEDAASRD